MTVEQHDVVDFVGIDPAGNVVLTVSDHLRWDSVNEQLFCLQEQGERLFALYRERRGQGKISAGNGSLDRY
jgi:hypothetical protein